jgi:serine protease Do
MPSPLRILLTSFTFAMTTLAVAQEPKPLAVSPESRTPDLLRQFDTSLETLVAKVSPAVVQIQVTGVGPITGSGKSGVAFIARQRAIGSGVIVDPEGYIVTNAHVVESAQRIRVVLPLPPSQSPLNIPPIGQMQVLEAKLVGLHKDTDLAVLKVDGHNLPFLRLGTTQPVHTGEMVLAIGSPEGLQSSVTMGVVSSAWRQPDPDQPMVYIQTDAPINPGNSGGPLINLDGDVIGLNTFILSEGGGSEGLGFAIPARVVGFVYANLRKYGHVHRTEIQVGAQTVTATLAAGLGLPQNWGVVISDVIPKGPADVAGLKVQDIVVAIDGRPILGLPGLTAALYLHPADQVVRIDVLRGNQKISLNVPAIEDQEKEDHLADFINPNNRISQLGVYVLELDEQLRAAISSDVRIPSGVVVLGQSLDLNALTSSLRAGDIIHALNRVSIQSADQLRSALRALKPGDPVVLQIERSGQLQYVDFEME